MKKCPVCGFNNLDSRHDCLKCNTALDHRADLAKPVPKTLPGLNFLDRISYYSNRFSRLLKRRFEFTVPEELPHRFPYLAGTLSLAPGLGQIYNHQPKKAVLFWPPLILFIYLAQFFIRVPWVGNIFIGLAISVIMISFADALVTAARINGQHFSGRQILAAMTYPFFLLGFFGFIIAICAWLNWPLFTLFSIRENYMAPAIQRGDRILGEGISYIFRDPRPGEVVHYNPPGFSVELPGALRSTVYRINAQNGWERVMAVGGETLECRDGVFYVDGKKLSQEYYPLVTGKIPSNFIMHCPEDKFIVLITAPATETGLIINLAAPDFKGSGAILVGWEEACILGKTHTEAGLKRKTFYDRALCIYHPSERRRLLTAKGPRFEVE
ncbi:MAG: S26 family signal peptidase [Candidatus Sumerlaeia bacterium]